MEGEVLNSHCFVDIDRSQLTRKLGPRKIRLRVLRSFLAAVSGSARTSPQRPAGYRSLGESRRSFAPVL